MTALCPLQAGSITPHDAHGPEAARGHMAQLELLVRNTPLHKHALPVDAMGAEPPLPGSALCQSPSSSPLPSLTLFDVLCCPALIHVLSDEPWGDTVCWGTRCLSGTPAPSAPGPTAPRGGLTLGCSVKEGMSLQPAQRVQAGVAESGPRDALQVLRWDAGTLSEGGTRGSWLTDEPDSVVPQDLLWALQVDLALVQEVFGLPPLPRQLEREGCRVGAELPPSWAVPPSRATLLPPSRTFPAPHRVAFGFRGSTGFATDAGVPLWWAGSPVGPWDRALRPPRWAWGRALPVRIPAALGLCSPGAR